jgi:hypothetical protein
MRYRAINMDNPGREFELQVPLAGRHENPPVTDLQEIITGG